MKTSGNLAKYIPKCTNKSNMFRGFIMVGNTKESINNAQANQNI